MRLVHLFYDHTEHIRNTIISCRLESSFKKVKRKSQKSWHFSTVLLCRPKHFEGTVLSFNCYCPLKNKVKNNNNKNHKASLTEFKQKENKILLHQVKIDLSSQSLLTYSRFFNTRTRAVLPRPHCPASPVSIVTCKQKSFKTNTKEESCLWTLTTFSLRNVRGMLVVNKYHLQMSPRGLWLTSKQKLSLSFHSWLNQIVYHLNIQI